jgi:hypothetical protein
MMRSEIDLTIMTIAIGGLWYLWDQGLKKLFLDWFREQLFELRFELFSLAESGKLSFDDEAYRSIETLLCGLLRFAHRVTFAGFLLSVREQAQAKKSDEYIDYHKQIELKISRTPAAIQETLRRILAQTHVMVSVYMAVCSLLFMAAAVVYASLRALNLVRDWSKKEISSVVENEAYRAEAYRRKQRPQGAAA